MLKQRLRSCVLVGALVSGSLFLVLSTSVLPASAEPLPPVTTISKLESVLGRDVVSRDGDGGRIVDLLADANGQVCAAVIEFGGFLGIGTRKIAVEWQALQFFSGSGRSVVVDVSRDQLRSAPEYNPKAPPAVVKAAN